MTQPAEEIAMNAKLIAALIATLIAASAHAEQKYGRDSVYVGKNDRPGTAAQGPTITRYGRDSVYVTNSPAPRPTKVTSDVKIKFGRA
jgi:hypothetical protein